MEEKSAPNDDGDRDEDVVRDEKADYTATGDINEETLRERRADTVWLGTRVHAPLQQNGRNRSVERKRRGHKLTPKFYSFDDALSQQEEEDSLGRSDSRPLDPGQRVQQLLQDGDRQVEAKISTPHRLFTEMEQLCYDGATREWRETARWVKFEEDVEEGGNRWSKPHVATLSLHSLFELRSCLLKGSVLLDVECTKFPDIADMIVDMLLKTGQIKDTMQDFIHDTLLCKHRHQYESSRSGMEVLGTGQSFLQTVRSFADIGRSFSQAKNIAVTSDQSTSASQMHQPAGSTGAIAQAHEFGSHLNVPQAKPAVNRQSSKDDTAKGNHHFFKKLPPNAEATNVLVGEVECLTHRLAIFIRLKSATLLELTEVPVCSRFLFVLLGPKGKGKKFREIGRAMATLMSDEIFCDVAYQARSRCDLLDGVDEFLDQVTVLPPGEWDPNIRIEPPTTVPSQEKRKQPKDEEKEEKEEALVEEEEKQDPTLHRTGRLFGGLIADIKRKIPWYPSDFRDALNLQCLAAFLYMYFAMLAPIVTFGGLLEEATDRNLAAIENLFSGAICGAMYVTFSGQPLTMIGSTGPVLVFEKIMFDLCSHGGIDFLSLRLWINFWSGVILLIMVATDASALVSYITRFTEESFSALISFIFIYEAIAKLIHTSLHKRVAVWNPHWDQPGFYNVTATCTCSGSNTTSNLDHVWKKATMKHWDTTGWLFKDDYLNTTRVDWRNVPLDYCETVGGHYVGNSCYAMYDVFLMSFVLLAGTFALSMTLKLARNSPYFPSKVREIVSDFAVFISITIMVTIDYLIGIDTAKLYVPEKFQPTKDDRGWLINPLPNPEHWWIIIAAILPALLLCILLFMDHQITLVIVNRKENKLKKGCGYHLDLLLISIVCFLTGFLGLPIFVAATVMSVSHVNALRVESQCRAPGEKPTFIGCREQRVTGIMVFVFLGLSVLMTDVLKHIPMPVLYGVFLYMGVSSLWGVQMIDRLLLLLMPMKYQPDYVYLRHVPVRRVHLFTFFQLSCFIVLCVVKEIRETSMVFPVMLVVMVGVRKLMEFVFTERELKYLDDKMPEITLRKREDAKKKKEKDRQNDALNQLKPVQTEANLHIPLTSGNVMRIPLQTVSSPEGRLASIDLSEEVNRSGLWRHICTADGPVTVSKAESEKPTATRTTKLPAIIRSESNHSVEEEDFDAVTIKCSPNVTEMKPLLNGRRQDASLDKTTHDSSAV